MVNGADGRPLFLFSFDLFDRNFHEFGHLAVELVVGDIHTRGVEIAFHLAEHVLVARRFEIGFHDLDRLGRGRFTCFAELFGGPEAQ